MDEEQLNMEIRKFLKKVGITSQREIEKAVRDAVAENKIGADATLKARVRLEVAEVG
ncbi:MAG: DUF6494 family protein, partial [Alphaproteobacteria bacterium]